MLHPVGPLPAAVYWRRRLVVLLVAGAVFGGSGWLASTAATRWWSGRGEASAAAAGTPRQVLPSLAGAQATPAACTDGLLDLTVRAPAAAVVGSRPTFELVVTNMATTACVRALGSEQQEIVLADAAGRRIWSSADCLTDGVGSAARTTLAPGQAVSLDVVWGGLSSESSCAADRATPPPGRYVLRGRLGTKVAADVPLLLS